MPTMCVATTRSMTSNRDAARIACARPVDAEGRHIGQHQGVEHNPGRPADPGFSIPFLREPIPAFTSLVTWDESGSSSHRYASDVPNTNCSCRRGDQRTLNRLGHTPEDHRWAACADCGIITDTTTHDDTVRCSMCTIWDQRAHEYAFMEKEALVDWTSRLAGGTPNTAKPRLVVPHDQPDRLYSWAPRSHGAFGGRKYSVTFDEGGTVGPADSLWFGGMIPWWLAGKFPANATIR